MVGFGRIKQQIGQWIEENRGLENASDAIDFILDNQQICISMEKSNSRIIHATVNYNGFVYKFVYKGNSDAPFDMLMLEHQSTIPSKYDD